ncbi:murein DD-endopeptidase MepM/ murein hydrolase activator NlpD [Catenulispora sp. MAP12-49]|uniref:M23 family metallopeptidase n=1 Tax=Catenulispora sp. MAP12-49 TaxID=3156302 RepID=UPI003516ECEE
MRLRRTLALAAVATALCVGLPALAYSGPQIAKAAQPSLAPARPPRTSATHDPGGDLSHDPTHNPAHTWTWPLAPPLGARRPIVVHPFQPPAKRWQAGHRGVDLLGGPGQEVLAAGEGTVSYAGSLFGRPVVAIDHAAPGRDALRTTYEPVDPAVKVGDRVRAGQLIGHLVDSSASHCAPRTCLHWGLVRGFGHGERYLDPLGLVGRGPVRLLPVWGVR